MLYKHRQIFDVVISITDDAFVLDGADIRACDKIKGKYNEANADKPVHALKEDHLEGMNVILVENHFLYD